MVLLVSGSVPHLGIKFVRIHFLLDLIHAVDASNVPGGASNTNFTIFTSGYLKGKALNWTDLDASLDIVIDAGLYPGFEVMGNPSGNLFTSFKDDNQLHAWSQMCYELARRYIARYGEDSVRQWRFESWNGWILTPACTFWHRAWLCDLFSPFGLRALVCVCVCCVWFCMPPQSPMESAITVWTRALIATCPRFSITLTPPSTACTGQTLRFVQADATVVCMCICVCGSPVCLFDVCCCSFLFSSFMEGRPRMVSTCFCSASWSTVSMVPTT